jgi:hypothetical protein
MALRIPGSLSDAALSAALDRLGARLMAEPEALATVLGHRHPTLGAVLAELEAAVRDGHDVPAALQPAVLFGAVLEFERHFIGRLLDHSGDTSQAGSSIQSPPTPGPISPASSVDSAPSDCGRSQIDED